MAGRHEHRFTGATATLTPRNDRDDLRLGLSRPRQSAADPDASVACRRQLEPSRLLGREPDRARQRRHAVATADRRRDSDARALGTAQAWIAASVGLSAETAVDGIAFTLFDGRAAYGATGTVNADGEDEAWFSGALPAGAAVGGDYPWEFLSDNELWAPFEPLFGATSALPSVDALRADAALDVLSDAELAQLDARGVEGFIAYLKARADRADDLVDYGFIKVQTDVYRVRQLVLGTTAATRLAISPALATIAQAETAVASQEQISTFFQNLVTSTPAARTTPPSGTAPAAPGNVRITRSAPGEPPAAFETIATATRERGCAAGGDARGHALGRLRGSIGGYHPGERSGVRRRLGAVALRLVQRAPGDRSLFRRNNRWPADGRSAGRWCVHRRRARKRPGHADRRHTPVRRHHRRDLGRSDAVRAVTDLGLIGISAAGRAQANAPSDVVNAPPIVGKANIRTTAIAQRLRRSEGDRGQGLHRRHTARRGRRSACGWPTSCAKKTAA